MRIRHTFLVGVGGTGGWLAEPLAALLRHHPMADKGLTLVDGDTFDAGNATRQAGAAEHLAANKAEAMRQRLAPVGLTSLEAIPHYLDGHALLGAAMSVLPPLPPTMRVSDLSGAVCVVLAVDNDATRASVMAAFDQYPGDLLMVLPGNTYESGMVSAYAQIRGTRLGPDPRELYANFRTPEDRIPGGGCSAQLPSTPQLLSANLGAAWGALCVVQSWLDDTPMSSTWHYHTRTMKAAATGAITSLPGQAALDAMVAGVVPPAWQPGEGRP